MKRDTLFKIIGTMAFAFLLPPGLQAQVLTPQSNVTLSANLAESLTISLTGASSVSFTLVPGGVATGSSPVAIQTSWLLKPGRTLVRLVGYFDTTDALTDAGPPVANISSANVLGQVNGGGFSAFTQTISGIGTAGASLELFNETITGLNKSKTRNDTLDLEIDLSSVPQQAAGSYTGILRIQAIAL